MSELDLTTTRGLLNASSQRAGENVIRISIGLEDPRDLIKDLDYAMQ